MVFDVSFLLGGDQFEHRYNTGLQAGIRIGINILVIPLETGIDDFPVFFHTLICMKPEMVDLRIISIVPLALIEKFEGCFPETRGKV